MENQLVASAASGGGGDENNNLDEIGKALPVLNADESDEDELGEETSKSKGSKKIKRKVIWTNSLTNSFLKALNTIGLHNAVPKKILKVMNVPGVTRINVGSHLQKYRIFLKKVSAIGMKKLQNPSPEKSMSFSSRIASVTRPRGPRLNRTFLNFQKESAQLFPGATSTNGASTLTPKSGPFVQSQPPSNRGNMPMPKTDITSLINQGDHNGWFSRLVNSSNQQNNDAFQFRGDLSRGLSGSFDASGSTSNAYNVLEQWNSCNTSNNEVSHEENKATSSTPTNASDVIANWNWNSSYPRYNEVSHNTNTATSSTPSTASDMFANWNWSNTSFNEASHDKDNATSLSTPTNTSAVFANWNSSYPGYNEVSHNTNIVTSSTPSIASDMFANWNWSNTSFNEVSHDKNNATSTSIPTNTSDVFANWNSCNMSYNEVVSDTNNASTSTLSEQEHNFVGYTVAGIQRFLESAPPIQDTNSNVDVAAPVSTNDSHMDLDPMASSMPFSTYFAPAVEDTSSNVDVAGPVSTNDSHMDLDPMASSMPFSAYFAPDDDTNAGANDQYFPSDVIAESFQPSDHLQEHFLENVEDRGNMQESDYTRQQFILDLAEVGIVISPIDEPEEEGDLNFVVEDHQVNAQNPHLEQIIGGEDIGTSSSQGVGMTHWNNNASSNLEQVLDQRLLLQGEEDEFLESLLAPELFGEDYTYDGQWAINTAT